MSLASPIELGAPDHFPSWRDGQEEAVNKALSSKTRFTVLCLPTGFGKSLAVYAVHLITGQRTAVLTSTKGLQDQVSRDFESCGITDIRGMSNYECLALTQPYGEFSKYYDSRGSRRRPGCDEGPCRTGYYCSLRTKGCLYFDAVAKSKASESIVTNPALWFHTREKRGDDSKLGGFDLLICDEVHSLPDLLSNHLRTSITAFEMVTFLNKSFPKAPPKSWSEWAKEHLHTVRSRIDVLKSMGPPLSKVREMRFLSDLESKFSRISNLTADWIYEKDNLGGGVWEPIWVAPYAEEYLFAGIKRVILTSATVRRKTVAMLGVKPHEYTFYEAKSSFPLKHRSVVHVHTTRLSAKSTPSDLETVVDRIDQILRLWPDTKGIIHTVSYARARLVFEKSEFAGRLMLPESSTTKKVVDEWFNTPSNRVLVSPSVTTGWDFPGLHGFQIIMKLAFPDPRGEVAKHRQKQDPDWGIYAAIQDLVQASGRMIRSAEDTCVTYVLDDTLVTHWIRRKLSEFAPTFWTDAFSSSRSIPRPTRRTSP